MREARFMICTGGMGVGKSFTTNKFLDEYHKQLPNRKILVFDPNNEDIYNKYPTVHFDIIEIENARETERKKKTRIITKSEKNIGALKDGEIRRVAPFTIFGDKMSTRQMKVAMITMCEHFRNGLLLLEDVNKYIINFQREDIMGSFKAIRHNSQDIIMHMQSISPIRPIHFEACSTFRMHYDRFDVSKIKDRLESNYEILKIAQLIIQYEYLYNNNTRYFLYIQHNERMLSGVTKDQFIRACNTYLTTHPTSYAQLSQQIAYENKRSSVTWQDKQKAMQLWIDQHMYYLTGPKK